jgi:hypothetical protein
MQPDQTPGSARKRNKVRSVWISFAGRIAAQLIGSIATVTLGVIVLGKGAPARTSADTGARPNATVLIATPVRTHGETVIVMLPVGKNGKVDEAMASGIAESYEKTKAESLLAVTPADASLRTPTGRPAPQSAGLSADTHATLESRHE